MANEHQYLKEFPLGDDFGSTRVPNAVLSAVLNEVEESETVKLILRAVWLLERQRGFPASITVNELRHDRVLVCVFKSQERFDAALDQSLNLGVLIKFELNNADALMLNTVSATRQVEHAKDTQPESIEDDGWDASVGAEMPDDAFRAYEENIGILSPMIRENITAALQDFSDQDIIEAIKIAVENENRSWSYVAGVLRKWARDGVPNDRRTRTSRGSEDTTRVPASELRRYLDQQWQKERSQR